MTNTYAPDPVETERRINWDYAMSPINAATEKRRAMMASETKHWRKKPVVVEATQWFAPGDHPDVQPYADQQGLIKGIGPYGWIETLEGGHIVSRGDWIITGVAGERYPCKPDIFAATYEPALHFGAAR